MRVLGIDPGSENGGAALLEGPTVLRWWAWQRLKRRSGAVYRLRSSDGATLELPHLHAVGQALASALAPGPVHLVVEGLYVEPPKGRRRRRVNPQAIIPLAESAGLVMGPLLPLSAGPVERPLATIWRSDVLGLPRDTSADNAEEYAVNFGRRRLSWPGDGLPPSGSYAEEGAVCEAACMAVWGQRRAAA